MQLYELALRFRIAIERCSPKIFPDSITLAHTTEFPKGACGDTTRLLAKYLEQQGCGAFDYMLGYRNTQSHAWLQRDDLVVDITADQFLDMPDKVIVQLKSLWHIAFHGKSQGNASFENTDDIFERIDFQKAYDIILQRLDK